MGLLNQPTFQFSANFNRQIAAPIDGTLQVENYADLIDIAIIKFPYLFMQVSVCTDSDNTRIGVYECINPNDITTYDSWKLIFNTSGINVTASNGLTSVDGSIKLGGNLIENTSIIGVNKSLSITGLYNTSSPVTHIFNIGSDGIGISSTNNSNYVSQISVGYHKVRIGTTVDTTVGKQFIAIGDNTDLGNSDNSMIVLDTELVGLQYYDDYSTIGKTNDRWIPDWGAVKLYGTSANSGIYKTSDNIIRLGGNLEEDVSISGYNGGSSTPHYGMNIFTWLDNVEGVTDNYADANGTGFRIFPNEGISLNVAGRYNSGQSLTGEIKVEQLKTTLSRSIANVVGQSLVMSHADTVGYNPILLTDSLSQGITVNWSDDSSIPDNGYITKRYVSNKLNNIHVFIVAGQSNAEGRGDSTLSLTPNNGSVQYYQSAISTLQDPVGGAVTISGGVNGGSMWPSFATNYFNMTNQKVCIVPTAKGSTSQTAAADTGLGNWDSSGTLYGTSVTLANNAISALNTASYTPILKGILWCQGEWDADAIQAGTITKADYKAALSSMIDRYRNDLGSNIPFYIFRTGLRSSFSTTGYYLIHEAQEEIANEKSNVFIVFRNSVDFITRNLMGDNRHWSQAGYNEGGRIGAEKVVANEQSLVTQQYSKFGIGVAGPLLGNLHIRQDGINNTLLESYGTAAQSGVVTFQKGNGTYLSQTTVASGDTLGSVEAKGYNGTSITNSASSINFVAAEAFTTSANGTGINFFTTAIGALSKTSRMLISSEGLIGIGTTPAAKLDISPGGSYSAWGANGIALRIRGATYTDTTTLANGTIPNSIINIIGTPTISSTNTNITVTTASTLNIAGAPTNGTNVNILKPFTFSIGSGNSYFAGGVYVGAAAITPLAKLHIAAGSATANTSPIKLSSGALLTTPEAGAIEFLTDGLYFTQTTGTTRQQLAYLSSPTFTGTPSAPTAAAGTNTTQVASTAFTTGAIAGPTYVVGDILYASTTSQYSRLADVAIGNVLRSGGIGAAPSYGKVTSAHVDPTIGVIAANNTWTGNNTFNTGSLNSNVGMNFQGGFGTSYNNTANTFNALLSVGTLTANRSIIIPDDGGTIALKLKPYTVSTLPTGVTGDTAYVTDALTPTYLGIIVGGGSVVTPVFYNGTNWVSF